MYSIAVRKPSLSLISPYFTKNYMNEYSEIAKLMGHNRPPSSVYLLIPGALTV